MSAVRYITRHDLLAAGWREAGNAGWPDGHGPLYVVNIDQLLEYGLTEHEKYEFDERQFQRHLAGVHIYLDNLAGRAVDKSDQDYAARVRRTQELQERASLEVRRLLEAFRPPDFVIETRRNLAPTPAPERTRFGQEHDRLASDPNTWIAIIKDSDPKGSDAHVYVMARTESGALAKLLAHIVDGGGFFPMT